MVHRIQFRAMGTDMLLCVDNGSDNPPAEMVEVPNWFEEWEQTLSRFRITSELSRLNHASSQPFAVSETLWQVFHAALNAERKTGGLVTPTVANAVLEIGYDRDFSQLAGQNLNPMESAPALVSPLEMVSWDESTRTIYLPAGVHLDFGGIAKGWAAEQVVQRLKHHGAVLMNCGGDIAMSGALLDGSPWEIGVFKPFDRAAGYVEMLYFIQPGAVATSATDRRRWVQGNILRHHIINPRTGLPATSDVISATVIAPTAVDAEAAAKSVLIRGSEAGLAWVEEDPDLAALLILDNGQFLYSQRMSQYVPAFGGVLAAEDGG
jgi:thiamine biosynthesis lipoprotein